MHKLSSFLCAVTLCQATDATSFNTVFTEGQQHQLSFDPIPIAYLRIDPVVSPGVDTASSHLHTLVGPNVLNSNSTSDQLRTATCTSTDLGGDLPDLSAYWKPSIYYVYSNGSFELLPLIDTVVYYDMWSTVPMQPFPQDFQMITGNASWLDGGCEDGHGPGDGYFYIPGQDMYTLPKTYVKTIGSHIQFPDCWDGLAFTKETQSEHMQYSLFEEGFPCPDPKWIKLPKITVSFNYETPGTEEEYPTNLHGPTYVLATGDQFGCSLHADFMNGWKSGVLQKVIDDCSNLGVNNAKDCPVFNVSSESDTLANECQYAELMPDEEIGLGKPVDALPGCLLINGVKAQGCNSNVDFVKPTKFDTQYRSPAGWPEVTTIPTTTSTISTSKMTTSTTITTSTSATSTRSTTIPTSSSVCIAGTGAGNYEGLCSFSCHYGYCPSGPCTCTAFGTVIPAPPMTGTPGSPLPGEDASYSGLCSFACNHGYCPSTACMT